MKLLTQTIRQDSEYRQLLSTLERAFRTMPLPLLASGLCEGAADIFLVSILEDSARARQGECALILCPEEKDCVRICSLLEHYGQRAAFYMARDLTFYNITASHEYEHERLQYSSFLISSRKVSSCSSPSICFSG